MGEEKFVTNISIHSQGRRLSFHEAMNKRIIITIHFFWQLFWLTTTEALLVTKAISCGCHNHHHYDNLRLHLSLWLSDSPRQKSFLQSAVSQSEDDVAADPAVIEKVKVKTMEQKADEMKPLYTNAIIRVSFDGRRFTGWSGANDNGGCDDDVRQESFLMNDSLPNSRRKARRRRQETQDIPTKGFVRSVEGDIRTNLAKIYGNVDPRRVIVEGCSRTDKGVHAQGMIAHIYCLTEEAFNALQESSDPENQPISIIEGKRIPHPISPTDRTYFEPIPNDANLSRMAFALNRMRPFDIQISGIAPTPLLPSTSKHPFHASLSAVSKTYEYRVSIGDFQDPTLRGISWYVEGVREWNMEAIQKGCEMLKGTHDFSAFEGSPRGAGDKKKKLERSPICTLFEVDFAPEDPPMDKIYFPGLQVEMFKFVIVGDKFLYKMSRMIVGALVALGSERIDLETFERAIEHGNWDIPETPDKRVQFTCAPAHGLILKSVQYDKDVEFDWQSLRY